MKRSTALHILAFCLGSLLLNFCRTAPPPVAPLAQFSDEQHADFIVFYYSDETSYVRKPLTMEGPFQTICDRKRVLNLAKQQPRHHLAVIVLTHYPGTRPEGPLKRAWVKDLKTLGYQRVVFLRAGMNLDVHGLVVLDQPSAFGLGGQ